MEGSPRSQVRQRGQGSFGCRSTRKRLHRDACIRVNHQDTVRLIDVVISRKQRLFDDRGGRSDARRHVVIKRPRISRWRRVHHLGVGRRDDRRDRPSNWSGTDIFPYRRSGRSHGLWLPGSKHRSARNASHWMCRQTFGLNRLRCLHRYRFDNGRRARRRQPDPPPPLAPAQARQRCRPFGLAPAMFPPKAQRRGPVKEQSFS